MLRETRPATDALGSPTRFDDGDTPFRCPWVQKANACDGLLVNRLRPVVDRACGRFRHIQE
jgi:hypothetical protein